MIISTPKEMRTEYLQGLISEFHYKWKLEIESGKKDEDIRVRLSSISNFELILDEFNPEVYTVYEEDGDTFVKTLIFTNVSSPSLKMVYSSGLNSCKMSSKLSIEDNLIHISSSFFPFFISCNHLFWKQSIISSLATFLISFGVSILLILTSFPVFYRVTGSLYSRSIEIYS